MRLFMNVFLFLLFALAPLSIPIRMPAVPATVAEWRLCSESERGLFTRKVAKPLAGGDLPKRVKIQRLIKTYINHRIRLGYTGKLLPLVEDFKKF